MCEIVCVTESVCVYESEIVSMREEGRVRESGCMRVREKDSMISNFETVDSYFLFYCPISIRSYYRAVKRINVYRCL